VIVKRGGGTQKNLAVICGTEGATGAFIKKELEQKMVERLHVRTSAKTDLVDITGSIQGVVQRMGVKDGFCFVFVPHTTAAVTINENADPSVPRDILMELNKIVPFEDRYQHMEGNSAAHIKASLVGFSQMVFVESGRLVLGTWQGIFFCEFDGPRSREVYVKVVTTGHMG
jgi:secondary thiamine-phosphate synthase enzyme